MYRIATYMHAFLFAYGGPSLCLKRHDKADTAREARHSRVRLQRYILFNLMVLSLCITF